VPKVIVAGRDRKEAVMVTDTKQITGLGQATRPEPSRAMPAERGGAGDRVSTDDSARLSWAVLTASQAASAGRTAKLAAIEAAVRQGACRADPQRIAQDILDDAELAARLQALLSR
jgi:anti-sigma28 factor (negative regulator of flagellin synthesis)